MFIESIVKRIDELQKESDVLKEKKAEIVDKILVLEEQKIKKDTEKQQKEKYSTKAKYSDSYVIGLILLGIYLAYLFTEGFGGKTECNTFLITWVAGVIKNNDMAVVKTVMVISAFAVNVILAIVLWLPVDGIKRLILCGKNKKNKAEIERISSESKKLADEIRELEIKAGKEDASIKDNQNLLKKLNGFLPVLDDYEKAVLLSQDSSDLSKNIGRIYSLYKSSTEEMSKICGSDFRDIYNGMKEGFEGFKKTVVEMESGDALAFVAQQLMAEDYEFALGLMQKSADLGSETGKFGLQTVLNECEEQIYSSQYDLAIVMLEPLKNAGNTEAKELIRKAKDFKHQEKINGEIREERLRREQEEEERLRRFVLAEVERKAKEEEEKRRNDENILGSVYVDVSDM